MQRPLFLFGFLCLLTLGLYFGFDAFPWFDRPTSFVVLFVVSVMMSGVLLVRLIARAKSAQSLTGTLFALFGVLCLSGLNGFILLMGGLGRDVHFT